VTKKHHPIIAVTLISVLLSYTLATYQIFASHVDHSPYQTINPQESISVNIAQSAQAKTIGTSLNLPLNARFALGDAEDSTPKRIERALDSGRIDRETADLYMAYALVGDARLPNEYISDAPWCGTYHLARLQHAASEKVTNFLINSAEHTLLGSSRREIYARIQTLLADRCNEYTASLPNVFNTDHFYIQYGTIAGGLTIQDYANALENAWKIEVEKFGWPQPPALPNSPINKRTHVRIDLARQPGLYGLTSAQGEFAGTVGDNPNTAWRETQAEASCIVLNRDYSKFSPTSALNALNATAAHEYVHAIHYGVGIDGDLRGPAGLTFAESIAVMMEDEVANDANDNYNYLWPQLDICLGAYDEDPYKYWIVMRAMTEQYGAGNASGAEQVFQDMMTVLSQKQGGRLTALNQGFVNKGSTLGDAFHAAAITLRYTKACGGGYAYPYCFGEAQSYIGRAGIAEISGSKPVNGRIDVIGQSFSGSIQNHFTMNWVDLPVSTTPYPVVLQNTSNTGIMKMSVVCDTGNSLTVTDSTQLAGAKGYAVINEINTANCKQVSAIITNRQVISEAPRTCQSDTYILRTDSTPQLTFMPWIRR
jgi:hypothetical protein